MCDESGASIDAPLPAPPADAGEISALDCLPVFEDAERVLPGTPGEPSNLPTVAAELVALLPWAPADVDPSRTGTSLRPTEQLVVAGEHKRRVYRPPCGA